MFIYEVHHYHCNNGRYTVVSNLVYGENDFIHPIGFEFAVSFCSPKDKFNRKTGRKIAYTRFIDNDEKYYRYIPIKSNRKPKHVDFRDLTISTIFATMDIPRWMTTENC